MRRFPSYLGSVEEYVLGGSEEAVAGLSDAQLDEILEKYEDFLWERGFYRDSISLHNIGDDADCEIADEKGRERHLLRLLLVKMVEYEADLIGSSFEELKRLYDKQVAEDTKSKEQLASVEDRGRFFNEASAAAEYDYWDHMAVWSAGETAALLLGKDPRIVNGKAFKRYSLKREASPFIREFSRLTEVFERGRQANRLPSPTGPLEVANWALQSQIPCSPEFAFWASQRAAKTEATAAQSGELTTSEKHSMYKVILGLAAAHYGYLPKNYADERNSAYVEITENANLAGFTALDVKTVRKFLKQAAQWAHMEEIKLSQPSPDRLKGNSSRK